DLVAGAEDDLRGAAADVENERGPLAAAMRSRPQEGEVGLLLAGEQACVEGEALAELRDERLTVDGITDGAGRDRHDPVRAQVLVARLVVADHRADLLDRIRAEMVGVIHPAAQAGHRGAALDLLDPPISDLGDEQARGIRPNVDYGDSHPCYAP